MRLALQMKEAVQEPDAPPPRVSSGVSQFANSRQRLSIQSLLLQSDFVDDSHDIAAASPEGGPQGPKSGSEQPSQGSRDASSIVAAQRSPPAVVSSSEAWSGTSRSQAHPSSNNDYAPALGLQDDGEQRGLAFNPWMGYPGTEDLLSGGMNDDY